MYSVFARAEDDESSFVDCGECAKRCLFDARGMADDEKKYDETRCFGRGLCVSRCPSSAIRLVERKKAPH